MGNAEKKEKKWEKEVRKIATKLIDPDEPLAKSGKKEKEDEAGAGEPPTEEV